MAVITKFVVVRNGVELDKEFPVKREAEAYDKMLDAADNLAAMIKDAGLDIDLAPATIDAVAVYLAQNGPQVSRILRGVKPTDPSTAKRSSPQEKKVATAATSKPSRAAAKATPQAN